MPLIRSNDTYRQELDGVYFGLQDGRKVVACMVSNEALDDYIRGSPKKRDRASIFLKIRPRIEAIASAKYDAGRIETDGTLRVDTRDLNPDQVRGTAALRAMKKPREVIQPRWGVYVLKRKAERMASVNAKDEKEALERAIKAYDVPESERWRISVEREA
jgi:Protein of unknown function (DUF1488)